ncbi:MAG: M23 family metallopeptidase [bacterium]|nr:M23 family metallopeptidase [Candidatus Margulisiibacteriota bacterium]
MNKLFIFFGVFASFIVLSFGFFLVSCTGVVVEPITDPPLLSSPIYSSAEVARLNSLFWAPVVGDAAEFGTHHNGIDIVFVAEAGRVRATVSGEVIAIADSRDRLGPIRSIRVKYNDKYSVFYVFEPAGTFYVSVGDYVSEGDIIGTLGLRDAGEREEGWLHFEVDAYDVPQCPVMFFNTETRAQFEALYNLYPIEGLSDPCYLHPDGCPSLHD